MRNAIAVIAGLVLSMYYALTALALLPLLVALWVLKRAIAGIRWLQEAI